MNISNQQIELSLTNHLQPVPSYPAEIRLARSWQQRYLLDQLDQIWFLPVWFWPDFWSPTPDLQDAPKLEGWRQEALPDATASPVPGGRAGEPGSTLSQWLSVQISEPGSLPLVELQGPGQLALPNGNIKSVQPVTTTILTAEGTLRLDGASLRLPAGLPGVLTIAHQPVVTGKRRWQINLALHHPEHGPFFEFQGVFRLPQVKNPGLADQLQTGIPIRQVLELL